MKGYENYKVYENGDVYNITTSKKKALNIANGNDLIGLYKNSKEKMIKLSRLVYESFYNEELSKYEIIVFKDEKLEEKFHYKNLKKIKRTDLLSETHDELDPSKEWKFVKNTDKYKVSNHGDVFSIKNNKMMTKSKNFNDYYHVTIDKKKCPIHRLVYDAFKNLSGDKNLVIDHIDRDRGNNHINNLREVSLRENALNSEPAPATCYKIHQFTLDNKFIKEWNSLDEIYNELGFNKSNISSNYLGKKEKAHSM